MSTPRFDVVVPTIGRSSLCDLLTRLDTIEGPRPGRVVVVDDRRRPAAPLSLPPLTTIDVRCVRSHGRGPAAARNCGWRRCSAPWIAFLDDDVIPSDTWYAELAVDLAAADPCEAAVQGTVRVPPPHGRRATDAERQVRALESAVWITADMAVRRRALDSVGGFDERFRRAYREDTDLALRLIAAGWQIGAGRRRVVHPVRRGTWLTSVLAQRGNADDALMRRLHGPGWRTAGHAPAGDLARHVVTTSLVAGAVGAAALGHRRLALCPAAATAARVAHLWWRRARRGPWDAAELGRLLASSAVLPIAACGWAAWGSIRARVLAPRGPADRWSRRPPQLVLFDRDGTLVHDVPYNADPDQVRPVDGASRAVARLRQAGIAVGIVTNQSGVGRGMLTTAAVDAVNARVSAALGGFDVIEVCPHTSDDACRCRKPSPTMVERAARRLGLDPEDCAVVGDIGTDVEAGLAAGARTVLVPTAATRPEEVADAPEVAQSLDAAIDHLLGEQRGGRP